MRGAAKRWEDPPGKESRHQGEESGASSIRRSNSNSDPLIYQSREDTDLADDGNRERIKDHTK
jgi:hypothetical protein